MFSGTVHLLEIILILKTYVLHYQHFYTRWKYTRYTAMFKFMYTIHTNIHPNITLPKFVCFQNSKETLHNRQLLTLPCEQSIAYEVHDSFSNTKDNQLRQVVYASLKDFIPTQSSTTSCNRTSEESTVYASIRVSWYSICRSRQSKYEVKSPRNCGISQRYVLFNFFIYIFVMPVPNKKQYAYVCLCFTSHRDVTSIVA